MQRGSVFRSTCSSTGQQRQEGTLNALNAVDDLFGYPNSPEYSESQMSPTIFNEGRPRSLNSTTVIHAALPVETARIEVQNELSSLRSEVHSLRKQMKGMAEKQDELLNLIKAMKRNSDLEYFDLNAVIL
ncbi:Hypothetical predicted protein [Paramuricea clavata]|uniref:Uncharacterized protein n=1 Tax=Paramuricea clavata TaxID=317549 RepID=A0A6S7IGE9_PARCT|nr:Hypothetical predicted protein [Paramuricea clavata]